MHIKAAYLYQVDDHKKSIITYYLILVAIYLILLTSISVSVTSVSTETKYLSEDGNTESVAYTTDVDSKGSIGGMEFATAIFVFVVGCTAFKDSFGIMLQNGISRKTLFISRSFASLTIAFLLAVFSKILLIIFKLLSGLSDDALTCTSVYEQVYLKEIDGIGNLPFHITGFFYDFFLFLTFIALGYFISLIYYRLGKMGKILLSVGVPAIFFVILPYIDTFITDGKITKTFNEFIDFAYGISSNRPINSMVTGALLFLLLSSFSWLLMRRATIKN